MWMLGADLALRNEMSMRAFDHLSKFKLLAAGLAAFSSQESGEGEGRRC